MSSVIKAAHGRVNNALKRGLGVMTPLGTIFTRPEACQRCGAKPRRHKVGLGRFTTQAAIQAHHYAGYGTLQLDLTVIFVCRPCHAVLHGKERRQHGAS